MEIGFVVTSHEPDENLSDYSGPDRPQAFTGFADLCFFKNVIPQRRVLMQAVCFSGQTIRTGGDFVGR
jgi:hypothetical protein